MKSKAFDYASAVAGVAMMAWIVSPGRNSAKVLEDLNKGFAASIKAATTVGPESKDWRTAADKYRERAMQSIADFWEGFAE